MDLLVAEKKDFLILANQNNFIYKTILRLFTEDRVKMGESNNSGHMTFLVPNDCEPISQKHILKNGQKYLQVPSIRWLTTLESSISKKPLQLTEIYSPEKYPVFDYYPAINVDVTKEIPSDYYGLMGVPITFLDKYCPTQFQIIDCLNANTRLDALGLNKKIREENGYASMVNGKAKYARIIIKRKQS